MGDLLENKERQAAYAKCATDRGELARILAGADAPGYMYTTDDIVAELGQGNSSSPTWETSGGARGGEGEGPHMEGH